MISLLLLVVHLGAADVEIAPPVQPGIIAVEALMRLPTTGPRERAELEVIADCLLDDTADYGHRQMIDLTAESGYTVRCDLYPDCLRVRFAVMEPDAASVVPMLADIIHSSELHEDVLKRSIDSLTFKRHGYWASALEPEALPYRRSNVDDIHTLYRVLGQPDNLVVTFAATSSVGQRLADEWVTTMSSWPPSPARMFLPDDTTPKANTERRGKLTTVVLRGAPLDPRVADLTTKVLALFALGGGKDSAVWKALRDGLGWSYRQEALLRNSPRGFEPDIAVVTERSDMDGARALQVRPALEHAVASWTDADRIHAIATADTLFDRGLGLDPFYFKSTRPSLDDPLFMKTYWRMKTGHEWRPDLMLAAMGNVDLKSMKAAAQSILQGAGVEVIRGTG